MLENLCQMMMFLIIKYAMLSKNESWSDRREYKN